MKEITLATIEQDGEKIIQNIEFDKKREGSITALQRLGVELQYARDDFPVSYSRPDGMELCEDTLKFIATIGRKEWLRVAGFS